MEAGRKSSFRACNGAARFRGESAMQTCETELCVCCKSIVDSEKIVVFDVVPDARMTKVMEHDM